MLDNMFSGRKSVFRFGPDSACQTVFEGFLMRRYAGVLFLVASLGGCAVIAVADAAVTVVATTVTVGAKVVGTAADVAASGVKAIVGQTPEKK